MLHEVSFPSYNKRDEVQGWIYVTAARPKGIVQIIHGFGEHSRRYLHMISKFMDAEKYPNLPYFLFGHSMGSFIARDYAAKYGDELAGVTICGTT